ncbi:MAG: spermidine synthase [Planctomycetota bacterium]|jgi:spermidine synthase
MSTEARSSFGLLATVALAGAGTMVVELAAVRVLAPWFGTSAAVWTNVIGVVLLAMSLGYLIGSRLSIRERPLRALGRALVVASLVIAWLPAATGPMAGLFLPEGGTLDRSADLLLWGSLAASFVLFSPAALALGCVGPLAVECVQQRTQGHAGTAGGTVLFASTLGSLVGTFGTTHYLIPTLGVAASFYVAAGTLALLGFVVLWRARSLSAASAVLLLMSASAAFGGGYVPPNPRGQVTVLESVQSLYQVVRVVESGSGEARTRQLQVNEGMDSFQSVWQPNPGLLGIGYYYNYFCLPAWWSLPQEEWKVMVLGLGAGTAWRVLDGTLPIDTQLEAHGVEIDPKVIELAKRWMDLPEDGEHFSTWSGWDARAVLTQQEETYDQIILDTYANQMEVPAHLCSLEFFEEVLKHLPKGGWLSINIGGFGVDDPVVDAIAQTAATAFGQAALVVRVPFARNCIAYLRRDMSVPLPGKEGWEIAAGPVGHLLPPILLEGAWRLIEPSGEAPLTDDRNPIEKLQRESIALAAERLSAFDLAVN